MSFHATAEDIRVEDGHILKARLRNGNGDLVDAELDLNQYLGNYDGCVLLILSPLIPSRTTLEWPTHCQHHPLVLLGHSYITSHSSPTQALSYHGDPHYEQLIRLQRKTL